MAGLRLLRGADEANALAATLGFEGQDLLEWIERDTELIKSERHSRVGLVDAGKLYHCKLYLPKSALQRVLFRLGQARALNSFDMALRLREQGIAVPEPVACFSADGALLLVTEGLRDARDLKSLWTGYGSGETFSEALTASATALAALHGAGFCHGDCKWSNFLIDGTRVLFVDLENVATCRPGSSQQVRDIARFILNAEDMGLPQADFDQCIATYAAELGVSVELLLGSILPVLKKLRGRHRRTYGERGHPLV